MPISGVIDMGVNSNKLCSEQ